MSTPWVPANLQGVRLHLVPHLPVHLDRIRRAARELEPEINLIVERERARLFRNRVILYALAELGLHHLQTFSVRQRYRRKSRRGQYRTVLVHDASSE